MPEPVVDGAVAAGRLPLVLSLSAVTKNMKAAKIARTPRPPMTHIARPLCSCVRSSLLSSLLYVIVRTRTVYDCSTNVGRSPAFRVHSQREQSSWPELSYSMTLLVLKNVVKILRAKPKQAATADTNIKNLCTMSGR